MMGDDGAVSALIAVRNGERFLEPALQSLMAQTVPIQEIIIVDDGSDDGTPETLRAFRAKAEAQGPKVTILTQPRLGMARARNAAVAAASNELLLLFDADDVAHPTLIETMAQVMMAEPLVALAFARVRYMEADGTLTDRTSPAPTTQPTFADFLRSNPMHSTSGTMLRASALQKVGGFDEDLTAMADVDMAVRLGQRHPKALLSVDQVLVDYRKHPGQVTSDWRRLKTNWERVFDKARASAPEATGAIARQARASNQVFWATMAYQAGDYAQSRRMIASAWAKAPGTMLREPQAFVRALACAATLLPRPVHDGVRAWFNGQNKGAP